MSQVHVTHACHIWQFWTLSWATYVSFEHFNIIIFFRKHYCDTGLTLLTQDPGHLHNAQPNPPFPTFPTNYTFKLVSSNTFMHHGWCTNFNFILLQDISKVRVNWSTTEEEEINPKTSSTISSYTISPPLCQILVKVSKCPDFVIDSIPIHPLCLLDVDHISNMSKLSSFPSTWNFQNTPS